MLLDRLSVSFSPERSFVMPTTALVHFVEPWPDSYRSPVRRAIDWLEASQWSEGLPSNTVSTAVPAPAQALWVVSHYAVNGLELFVAQKTETAIALTARSVDELCHNIRELRLRAPRAGALFQLMYRSAAVEPMDTEALHALLAQARARNSRWGITGLLLYKKGRFLQVLEGLEQPVRDLFASIARDTRHTDIQIVFTSPIERRTFPDWQMGFIACDATDAEPAAATQSPAEAPLPLGGDLSVRAPLVGNVADALGPFRTPRRRQG